MSVLSRCFRAVVDARCPHSLDGSGARVPSPGAPALFLDRDGVINRDDAYVHRADAFDFVPGVFELARAAARMAMPVVVVTNQAGIARGLYGEADFAALTHWMCERFLAEDAPITRIYYCPHHVDAQIDGYRLACACRKPEPGMILAAAGDLQLDLGRSLLVGDKASDMAAGARAGVGTLVLLGDDPPDVHLGVVHRLLSPDQAIELLAGARS